MVYFLAWCISSIVLGFICLPISFATFKYLPDRGFAFSKIIGLLLVSYLLWLAGSFHLLPSTRFAIGIALMVLLAVSALLFWRYRWKIVEFLRANLLYVLTAELLFLVAFGIAAVVRAYNPAIAGTEKPMDFAFFNSAFRALSFPPPDPWYAGGGISYYYLGYLMMATMTKLNFTPTPIGFNLSLALLFGLAAVASFGLVYNLVQLTSKQPLRHTRAIGFGLLAPVILLVAANLEGILEFVRAYGFGSDQLWRWLNIAGLEAAPSSGVWPPTESWWWWRASRIISAVADGRTLDYTITEFPSFSFLLGDLHPHLMALPFTLMALGLSLNILFCGEPFDLAWLRHNWPRFGATVLGVGSLGFLNSWDLPTYGLVLGAVIMLQVLTQRHLSRARRWIAIAVYGAIVLIGAFVLFLPFYRSIHVPLSGVLPWHGPSSWFIHYTVIWGLFLFVAVSLLIKRFLKLRSESLQKIVSAAVILLIPWMVWSLIELLITFYSSDLPQGASTIADKLWQTSPYLMLTILALLLLIYELEAFAKSDADGRSFVFVHLLVFGAFLLTLGPEYFYIVDVFHNRMNTVFKFYYQAWTMMAVAVAFSLYYFKRHWHVDQSWQRWGKGVWYVALSALCFSSFLYTFSTLWTVTKGFSGPATLDGMAYFDRTNPGDAAAIRWINATITGTPGMVEAWGDDWTEYGRVSSFTGLPTPINWAGHEAQWRGGTAEFQRRQKDVDAIFQGQEPQQVPALLNSYGASYVYFGTLEKNKYGAAAREHLARELDVVYDRNDVAIFKLRQ